MKNVSFLIVDDSHTVRSVVKSAIYNQFGSHSIYTAGDGTKAKELLLSHKIDLIVSDWEMPKMSGQELLRFVRGNTKTKDIPFVMMTTRGGKESVLEAIQNGVSHYIVKPFTTEKLEDAVRRSWNSATKRRTSRIAGLPEHTLSANFNTVINHGKISNISASGALMELDFNPSIELFSSCIINLSVKMSESESLEIQHVEARVIRLEAKNSSDVNDQVCYAAVIFNQEKISKKSQASLTKLLSKMTENIPKVINNAS